VIEQGNSSTGSASRFQPTVELPCSITPCSMVQWMDSTTHGVAGPEESLHGLKHSLSWPDNLGPSPSHDGHSAGVQGYCYPSGAAQLLDVRDMLAAVASVKLCAALC